MKTVYLKGFRLIATALLACGLGFYLVWQQRAGAALKAQNELLGRRVAQLTLDNESLSNRLTRTRSAAALRLPAPTLPSAASTGSLDDGSATNLVALLMHGGDVPPLSVTRLNRYLEENHRSAASLLSAYRTSKDSALLREATEKYPNDPEVALEAVLDKNASPDQRRQWLEALEKAAPDNPLPNYLAALDDFKSGQTDQAVQELMAASGRTDFEDYTAQRIQADEEAFRAAGYSEAEARMAATWGIELPQLAQLKALGQNLVDLANSYQKAGDPGSGQAALAMAITLGQQLDASTGNCVPLVTRLVGMAVQRMAFTAMDASSGYGDGTVQQQLDLLAQRRNSLQGLVNQTVPLQGQMSTVDWINYNDRTLIFGEENAMAWLLGKYGQN